MKLKTYSDKTRSIGELETLVRMGNIVTRTLSDEYKCEGDFLLRPKPIEIWLLHLWARLGCSPWTQCCSLRWCLRGGNISCSSSSSLEKRKKWGRMRCLDRGEVYRHAVLARNWKLLWGSRLIHWKQGLQHLPWQKCTSTSSTYGTHLSTTIIRRKCQSGQIFSPLEFLDQITE